MTPAGPDDLREALAQRYVLERELGRGATATVYLAQDVKHERQVAIKVLRPDLLAVGLLLYPRKPALGAVLAVGLMVGAIGAHLTKLGIEVQGDKGTLFVLAVVVAAAALVVVSLRRRELPFVGHWF
jgi:serine/threonine protein kinase